MGFPSFSHTAGIPGGLPIGPRAFAEASDHPTHTALNLWRNSVGNPKFGPRVGGLR